MYCKLSTVHKLDVLAWVLFGLWKLDVQLRMQMLVKLPKVNGRIV